MNERKSLSCAGYLNILFFSALGAFLILSFLNVNEDTAGIISSIVAFIVVFLVFRYEMSLPYFPEKRKGKEKQRKSTQPQMKRSGVKPEEEFVPESIKRLPGKIAEEKGEKPEKSIEGDKIQKEISTDLENGDYVVKDGKLYKRVDSDNYNISEE